MSKIVFGMSRLGALMVLLLAVVPAAVAKDAQKVFGAPLHDSLKTETGLPLTFARNSEASYFDLATNRMVTVPTNVPRFVAAPETNQWGNKAGIFLEGGSVNELLDSSFEGDLTTWKFEGKVEKREGVGIHGQYGLAISSNATLTASLQLKVLPTKSYFEYHYFLSIYVRRADGKPINQDDVICEAVPEGGELDSRPLDIQQQGNGPWYRVAAFTGTWQENHGVPPKSDHYQCRFIFRNGDYYADCAQMEHAYSFFGTSFPSSYIPTGAEPATRALDALAGATAGLLPNRAWTLALWNYHYAPVGVPPYACSSLLWIGDIGNNADLHIQRDGVMHPVGSKFSKMPLPGWGLFVFTYDGEKFDEFYNGVSDHAKDGPFAMGLPAVLKARMNFAGGPAPETVASPWGLLSGISTWDRALTPDEVRGLYQTGRPVATAAKAAGAIPVDFKLKRAGRVSVNLFRKDGTLACQLAVGKKLEAGPQRLYWDGCDDAGKPVPVGKYEIRGLCSNVRSVWDGKVGNTSPAVGNEWLQYRTGLYSGAIALPDGGLITLSADGEHGRMIQRLSGPPDFPVRWTSSQSLPVIAAAIEGKYLYVVCTYDEFFDPASGKTLWRESLARVRLDDGMFEPYPDGETLPGTRAGHRWLAKAHAPQDRDEWYGRVTGTTLPFANADVLGIAARAGKLYVTHNKENRIGVLDPQDGRETSSLGCPEPRKIAADTEGNLYVTSGQKILRMKTDGSEQIVLAEGFEYACGVTVGPDGLIYATDLGNVKQVKVFEEEVSDKKAAISDKRAEGKGSGYKLVKTFGVKGGFKQGKVATDLLSSPYDVSVGPDGNLAVPDMGGRRVLALTPDFRLRKEIYGTAPYYCMVNNLDPALIYFGWPGLELAEFSVDYATGEARRTRYWQFSSVWKEWPLVLYGTFTVRQWGGRTFLISSPQTFVVELVDDRLIPRVWLGLGKLPATTVNDGVAWDPAAVKTAWVWRDRNLDGTIQASEVEVGNWKTAAITEWGNCVDAEGNLYLPDKGGVTITQTSDGKGTTYPSGFAGYGTEGTSRRILKVPFGGLDKQGLPIYTWANASWVFQLPASETAVGLDGKPYPVVIANQTMDAEGHVYFADVADPYSMPFRDMALCKYTMTGKRIWRAGHRMSGAAKKPGEVEFLHFAGFVDNRYLFYMDQDGSMNCWDADGLFVARLFSDMPGDLFLAGETMNGAAFRHPNGKVYAYSTPDMQECATRIVVDGIDDIERFRGSVRVKEVQPARRVEANKREWRILRRNYPVRTDGEMAVREWNTDTQDQAPEMLYHQDREVARAWAQWDDDALYLAWRVQDSTPAMNKQVGDSRWQGDQVEFMIRAALGDASGSHTAQEYQLLIGPDRDGKTSVYVVMNGGDKKGKLLVGAETALQILPDKTTYTMEARIPWASLGDYRPKKGDRIRWNMIVDFGTTDGMGQDHAVKWAPGWHLVPSSWGTAGFN